MNTSGETNHVGKDTITDATKDKCKDKYSHKCHNNSMILKRNKNEHKTNRTQNRLNIKF